MDVRGAPSVRLQNTSQSFSTSLASAVLEWLLMFMLLLDASFSFLVTKFARYCELQIPCLLCSRLDHVLGKEKKGFYWDLICGNHKLETSSLVFCHVHNKLVDVHEMCENCLFSFATINKSNAETYRLLVGKMGADPPAGLDHDSLFEDHTLDSSGTRICSCCNEQCISRAYTQNKLRSTSNGYEVAEFDEPLSVNTEQHMDDLKKTRDASAMSCRTSHMGKNCCDPLSHIEYSKVNITSDTESEIPSDDDSANALIPQTENFKDDLIVQSVQLEPRTSMLADDVTTKKFVRPASPPKPSVLESELQLEVIDPHGSVTTMEAIGHGLEELNRQQVEHKVDISTPYELISFEEVPPSSVTKAPVEVSGKPLNITGVGEMGKKSATESEVISKVESEPITNTEIRSEVSLVTVDTGSQMPNYLDLGDAYKLAVGNRGRQLSGKLLEQRSLKDSARITEDLKLLLSQISAARGLELSLNDMSPRVSGNSDDLKTSDAPISIGMHLIQRRISLERNESGLSLDGSTVSEIEGEGVVDRLKRQVEHDRKLMGALYKELEEERNASAVATNQAMAMITRLQEEKAALHMEALQCLRMMEEQAEYDVEALQKANDLIADKEKEMQDLETELELCRKKMENVSMLENITESVSDLKGGDMRVEHSDSSCAKHSSSVSCISVNDKQDTCNKIDGTAMMFGNNLSAGKSSLLEFEEERLYILQCLKKLEKNIDQFSSNGVHVDLPNGEYSAEQRNRGSDKPNFSGHGRFQENDGTKENDLQRDVSISKGGPHLQEGYISSNENLQHISKESRTRDSGEQLVSAACRETDLVALRNEFLELSDKLEALEADQNFLEHSINSLRNGNEGLKFIQEIASQLRELHKIGIRRRDQHFA